MSERDQAEVEGAEADNQADPELEYLQQLVRGLKLGSCSQTCAHASTLTSPLPSLQIKDNEFLQRENLLLEAYLAKIDFSKIGLDFEEEAGAKVYHSLKTRGDTLQEYLIFHIRLCRRKRVARKVKLR
jgi:hypothetical protein